MELYKKGAEWRKWDLHIHTPKSICQKYGGDSDEVWEKYIEDLENLPNEFSVLGINDYLFLDGYERLIKEQAENGRLTGRILLPIIEFRIDKFAGIEFKELKRINLHVIFSNELSLETIKSQFLNTLEQHYYLQSDGTKWTRAITKQSVEELGKEIKSSISSDELIKYGTDLVEGFNNLNVKEDEVFNSLRKDCFYGKYLISIGKTEWGDLKWTDASIATKKSIINQAHIVFTSAESVDVFEKAKKQLENQKVNDLLLDCSDAHSFSSDTNKDRIGNCFTWIKADTTFDGLRQILNEHDRIFIGENPLIHLRVKNNRTKYINKIEISPIEGYSGKYGKWFQNIEIPLNHELVTIIGNKGSGKSAIADIIALCGNYKNQNDFSFLKRDRFRDGKHANNFEATLTWESGVSNTKNLSNNMVDGEIESVKYLPQGYFERLTNDFNSIQDFRKEIESIVYTHIDEDSKIGFSSFDELIDKKKEIITHEIHLIKEKLDEINKSIFEKEKKLNVVYKNTLEAQIKKKHEELLALIEPVEVKNPNDDPETAAKNKEINDNLSTIEKTIYEKERQINHYTVLKREVLLEINELKELKQKIKGKEEELANFIYLTKNSLTKHSINIDDVFTYKIEYTKIENLLAQKEILLNDYKIKLGEMPSDAEGASLSVQLQQKKTELEEIQKTLGMAEKKYQNYLLDKKKWEENKKIIIGDEKTPNTKKSLEKELKYVTEILQVELEKERKNRISITKSIYEKMGIVLGIYKDIKTKIDTIIVENENLLGQYRINIDASFNPKNNFQNKFLSYVSLNKAGTYYGKENAEAQINELIKTVDFDNIVKIEEFLNNIIASFFTDKRNDKETFIDNQVDDVVDLYNYIFSLDFLDYNYELKQGEKNLEQLSPGEKGALLLIFYLLLDNNDIPLLIDQPEDNLDNHSVANILVPFIKRAKAKRQIILVTHNPNLAVVSDAEQVVYVKLDKENNNTFDFKSGSIENPIINECIVKVLEGAMPAFNKRKQKYYE